MKEKWKKFEYEYKEKVRRKFTYRLRCTPFTVFDFDELEPIIANIVVPWNTNKRKSFKLLKYYQNNHHFFKWSVASKKDIVAMMKFT